MNIYKNPDFAGLNKSQKKVAYYASKNKNIFIEGVAGTGKTFLLKTLKKITNKNVELYATSGIASINLGGVTISSSYGLKLGTYEKSDREIISSLFKYSKKQIENTIVVIDEIGLLSTEQFRQIDVALRARGNSKEFLGGFQVILAGDFRQMPSISWGESLEESQYLNNFLNIELIENVRQKEDVPFFNILQKVRNEGITNEVKDFISKNHNPCIEQGITIVATRQLMDDLNGAVMPPKNQDIKIYNCDLSDENRLYDTVKLWAGMPVIICKTSYNGGYYNGDTGIVVSVNGNYDRVSVKLDRTGETVYVDFFEKEIKKEKFKMFYEYKKNEKKIISKRTLVINNSSYIDDWDLCRSDEDLYESVMDEYPDEVQNIFNDSLYYFPFRTGEKIRIINDVKKYNFMPILPANFLSIRRCQGLTLTKGILHESILNAEKYNSKDAVNIQYVALSRFEKTAQFNFKTKKEKLTIWV
ncbi:AAA family ATPase [Flavobacterium davisii]|uniref:AAA family ATPase n=1 Tax=Flavobacterium davisii TaxID=2906077 RepID=A0ABW8PR36_9FLAO|nr:AAA family ATPase [Flavobacterium covae]OWP87765.1 hypothetical protein BWK60_01895 [Flavobacterium covae]